MNATETSSRAATAWALMLNPDPMPAWAAVDFVQEETDHRERAKCLLYVAAGVWLRSVRPSSKLPSATAKQIERGRFTVAAEIVANTRYIKLDLEGDKDDDAKWLAWLDAADRAIALCRDIEGA